MPDRDTSAPPLRLVILTSPYHFYGNYLVKHLLHQRDICQVVGVVESEVLLPKMSYCSALTKYLRSAGTSFFLGQGLKKVFFHSCFLISPLLGLKNPASAFCYYRTILSERMIPVHRTPNINDAGAADFLENLRPDLMVILLFAQILDREIIGIPRLGCLNFHPSLLPKYRGLMPVFWALADGERNTGATLHWVDTGIDTGRIVDQSAIEIGDEDSEHSLYVKICKLAAGMLTTTIGTLARGEPLPGVAMEPVARSYRSVPTREAMREFKRRKRTLYRFSELVQPFERFSVQP